MWAFTLTVDEERGLVYMPVSSPGSNFYGGDRPGDNLFANSTIAIDIRTGELEWYFQNIHHELWDYNLPPAPGLLEIERDGERIPALAQVGKSGWMFILNRETGEPIYGVEERPVPAGDVPGEQYSPTQPIPLAPPPVARVGIGPDDIVTADDTTPAHAAACRERWDTVGYYNAGPYTPIRLQQEGTPPSLVFPGTGGGVNWNGTAYDPELGYIFVNSKDQPISGWMTENELYGPDVDDQVAYVREAGPPFEAPIFDADGERLGALPCFKPPWARLVAVEAATGDIAWEVPLGISELLPEGKQRVGSRNVGGPIVTAGGLVFVGATLDRRFPRVRRPHRRRAVVGGVRLQRRGRPHHLRGERRPAVRRGQRLGPGGRRAPRQRAAGGVRAACTVGGRQPDLAAFAYGALAGSRSASESRWNGCGIVMRVVLAGCAPGDGGGHDRGGGTETDGETCRARGNWVGGCAPRRDDTGRREGAFGPGEAFGSRGKSENRKPRATIRGGDKWNDDLPSRSWKSSLIGSSVR